MEPTDNSVKFVNGVITTIKNAGGNTVFLSPWSDGEADYTSKVATMGEWGKQKIVEEFIKQGHAAGVNIYAWFVVGKDDFPSKLHPEWYAKTPSGKNYNQEDEPGVFLPTAALWNKDYQTYHNKVIAEIASMPFDGYVISEPLISWDDTVIPRGSSKAGIVTNFVSQTMGTLRAVHKPVVITVYDEPNEEGTLKSDAEIKSWLGLDLQALVALKPDYIEVQDIFSDFEYPQSPAWTTSFINQYRERIGTSTPLMVSIQGYQGDHHMSEAEFKGAMQTALKSNIAGVSFYAYHLAPAERWKNLKKLW
jgi:uncharacterized lipoprotein YddW (UPF0748 family)